MCSRMKEAMVTCAEGLPKDNMERFSEQPLSENRPSLMLGESCRLSTAGKEGGSPAQSPLLGLYGQEPQERKQIISNKYRAGPLETPPKRCEFTHWHF